MPSSPHPPPPPPPPAPAPAPSISRSATLTHASTVSPSNPQLSFPPLKNDAAYVKTLSGNVLVAFSISSRGRGYYGVDAIPLNAGNKHEWNDYRLGVELKESVQRLTKGISLLSPVWQRKFHIVEINEENFCTRLPLPNASDRSVLDRLVRLLNDSDTGLTPSIRSALRAQHRWVDWIVDFSAQNPGVAFEYEGGAALTAFSIVVAFVAVGACALIVAAFVLARGIGEVQDREAVRQTWLSLAAGWLGVGSLVAAGAAVVGLAQDA